MASVAGAGIEMTLIQDGSQQAVLLGRSTMFHIILYNLCVSNDKASFSMIDAAELVSRISICGRQAI